MTACSSPISHHIQQLRIWIRPTFRRLFNGFIFDAPKSELLYSLLARKLSYIIQKNADSLELLRGKSGRVFGLMCGVNMSIKVGFYPSRVPVKSLNTPQGLPTTYNVSSHFHTNSVESVLPKKRK